MKVITASKVNPFRRALSALDIGTRQRWNHTRDLNRIKQQQSLRDPYDSTYLDSLSYSYKLFDYSQYNSLFQLHTYTDQDIGGDSTAQIQYCPDKQCLMVTGHIEAKNKGKLEQHPSFGIARNNPYSIHCGPFNAIQLELQGDGEPIHVGVQLQSRIEGVVRCYGIIVSKVKGWVNYELPFENMLLAGAETGHRRTYDYMIPGKNQQFFDRDAYDARRVLKTESTEPVIRDINLRILSTKTMHRNISLRNIQLVRRGASLRFVQQYTQPFFYIVKGQAYLPSPQTGVSVLSRPYSAFKQIDLGDKVYTLK